MGPEAGAVRKNEGGVISSLVQQTISVLERLAENHHDEAYHETFFRHSWKRKRRRVFRRLLDPIEALLRERTP